MLYPNEMLLYNTTSTKKITVGEFPSTLMSLSPADGSNKDQEKLEKPKRPLSSYNIFFRFERARILQDIENGNVTIQRHDDGTIDIVYATERPALNIEDVRHVVRNNTNSHKRQHRRTHGKIGFTELIKYMCKAWANLDQDSRKVFDKLASEEKDKYTEKLQHFKMKSQKISKNQQTKKMDEARADMLKYLILNSNESKEGPLHSLELNVNPLMDYSAMLPPTDQLLSSLKYSLSYQRSFQQCSKMSTKKKETSFSSRDSLTPSQRRSSILQEALNYCETSTELPLHKPKPTNDRSISILQKALTFSDKSLKTPDVNPKQIKNSLNDLIPTNPELSEVIGEDDDVFKWATLSSPSIPNSGVDDRLLNLKRSYTSFSSSTSQETTTCPDKKIRINEEDKDLATFLMDFDWKKL